MKKIMIILFFIAIFFFVFLWKRAMAIQLTMVNAHDEKIYKKNLNEYKKIKIEYEKLTSIERLENFAKETLNMVYPNGDFYVSGK